MVAVEGLANKPCPPMSDERQALGPLGGEHELVHWSAHYGSVGTVLQGIFHCVAVELITPGSRRSPRQPGEAELVAEIKKRGGIPRLPSIRRTCRPPAPPSSLPSVRTQYPPWCRHAHTHTHTPASVIIAIASLNFHSWDRSGTVCLLMRNSSYEPEVLFIYLNIYLNALCVISII